MIGAAHNMRRSSLDPLVLWILNNFRTLAVVRLLQVHKTTTRHAVDTYKSDHVTSRMDQQGRHQDHQKGIEATYSVKAIQLHTSTLKHTMFPTTPNTVLETAATKPFTMDSAPAIYTEPSKKSATERVEETLGDEAKEMIKQ